MANKERFQNPTAGDDLILRLFVYNSNNLTNVSNIEEVSIYFLDPQEVSANNPTGKRLIETITSGITQSDTGQYYVSVNLESPRYTIGNYVDVWTVELESGDPTSPIENRFEIYPDLWYTSPSPMVYDFDFKISPNKIRKGSKRYLIVDVIPNVPRASDLAKYYTNLVISSPLKISIEQACGDCIPEEADLRLIVDDAEVELRERCLGYYFLDTTDLDCGIYNVWFKMEFGNNLFISDKQQFQIF